MRNSWLSRFLLGAGLLLAPHVAAHEAPTGWFYPLECCSNKDCRALPDDQVKEGPDGYTVPSGEVIPMNDPRIRHSPDGMYHWCSVAGLDHGRTLCLFVPPRSY